MRTPLAEPPTTAFDVAGPEALRLDLLPRATLPLDGLRAGGSPRQRGVDDEHCRLLAENGQDLPPILVHVPTLEVIDGLHRVHAARLRGRTEIEARLFDGPAQDAFVLAVRLNIQHGLPLSRAERAAAAARIVRSHPQWSNRLLASATGLSAGTIAGIRARTTAAGGEPETRVGKDGRVRPVDGSAGRLRARELLRANPTASIREIARRAGVSPATVHDVRRRLSEGGEAVPPRPPVRQEPAAADGQGGTPAPAGTDPAEILRALTKDPSLRYTDTGRALLRWLDHARRVLAQCAQAADPPIPARSPCIYASV
ncbi:winged helix-turn-helix transcriptional regulator [Streptomyces sp. NPDC051940]|uniref:winged helix-turn-helix transcriptional regulator n=1 Tax=Streptomyces sp. NPDC051940 TaxID=3155675 RepID=UPI00342A8033